MVVASIAVFLGMFSFMFDLAYYSDGTQKYNISIPTSTEGNMTALLRNMNATARDLEGTLTGSEGWTQTLYNIFFTLPQSVVSTLSTVSSSGGKLLGIVAGDESKIPVPDWVILVVFVLIGLVIAFTLFYMVMGRNP